MPITLPSYVAPNELIQSAWGNAVVNALAEVDAEFAELAGSTFTGAVLVNGAVIRGGMSGGANFQVVDLDGSDNEWVAFYGDATGISTLGTRTALVGQTGTVDLNIWAEAAGADVNLRAANDVIFLPAEIETARVTSTYFLVGKTTNNIATTGIEIAEIGTVTVTRDTDTAANYISNFIGAKNVNGQAHIQFAHAGITAGDITRTAATTVAYNTSSDQRLKTDVGLAEVDGLDTIQRIKVRRYLRPDGDGEHVGIYAQELYDVIPQAVKVGGEDPFVEPWMAAYSNENLIGHLLLAVQQLGAELEELKAST